MLQLPHTSYKKIFVYHISSNSIPEIDDQDMIGSWVEGSTTIIFFHKPKEQFIYEFCQLHNCRVVYHADLDYRDWENGREISSFSVGSLTVSPVWESSSSQISLDPSVIFGNGFHPTTRLCLESLHQLLSAEIKEIKSVFDLGTGTGLLAIAAAKLGADHVVAIDENSLACKVARANVTRNMVEDKVDVRQIDLMKKVPETANVDLVIANLYHDLLEFLFGSQLFWQAKWYIISGFFSTREEALLKLLPAYGVHFTVRTHREKWSLWVLERRESVKNYKIDS